MQKLGFIPEPHNDMIFAIICEELGIVGAGIVILMFLILLWRIYDVGNDVTGFVQRYDLYRRYGTDRGSGACEYRRCHKFHPIYRYCTSFYQLWRKQHYLFAGRNWIGFADFEKRVKT